MTSPKWTTLTGFVEVFSHEFSNKKQRKDLEGELMEEAEETQRKAKI